ncbi:MAG: hypothetical protein H0X24_21245 [Ktedonobacterales bacterium]|nr:hypothetical protein [Ktedonobacterales bacterium]
MFGFSQTMAAWVMAIFSLLMVLLAVMAYCIDMRRGLRLDAVSGACMILTLAGMGAFWLGALLGWVWLIWAALGGLVVLVVVGTWAERRARRQERGQI